MWEQLYLSRLFYGYEIKWGKAQPPTKTTFSLRLPSRLATVVIIWIFTSLVLIMMIPSVL
jgi:hypothetical protein